jgi:voltage-gated sodium channel
MSESDIGQSNVAASIVRSRAFCSTVIGAILLGAVLVGLETVPAIFAAHGSLILALDRVVLAIFVIEAILKIAAEEGAGVALLPQPVERLRLLHHGRLPAPARFRLRAGAAAGAEVARSLRLITAIPTFSGSSPPCFAVCRASADHACSCCWSSTSTASRASSSSARPIPSDSARSGPACSTMFSVLTLEGGST